MWRSVLYLALHWQVAVVKPGTFRPWRNLASPIKKEQLVIDSERQLSGKVVNEDTQGALERLD
jgi:hypothetical protein